jgi:hypothetical protein
VPKLDFEEKLSKLYYIFKLPPWCLSLSITMDDFPWRLIFDPIYGTAEYERFLGHIFFYGPAFLNPEIV